MKGAFITATGTGVGKTWVSSALAAACVQRGKRVAAIKPIETGVDPEPLDAIELERACGRDDLAHAQGLYRAVPPLGPYAVEKRGGPSVGSLDELADRVRRLAAGSDFTIVEGAGGVLVPLDREHTIADLVAELALPAVVVARNELGVQSFTLTALEALRNRRVAVQAVVLNDVDQDDGGDISRSSNADVLADLLPGTPVVRVPRVESPQAIVNAAAQLCEILGV